MGSHNHDIRIRGGFCPWLFPETVTWGNRAARRDVSAQTRFVPSCPATFRFPRRDPVHRTDWPLGFGIASDFAGSFVLSEKSPLRHTDHPVLTESDAGADQTSDNISFNGAVRLGKQRAGENRKIN